MIHKLHERKTRCLWTWNVHWYV